MEKLLLLCLLTLTACGTIPEFPEIPEIRKSYSFKWNDPTIMSKSSYKWKKINADIKKNNREYTDYLVEQIKATGLDETIPSDAKDFNYRSGMDLVEFWGNILVEVMFWESGWNKDQFYKEAFNDGAGNNVISRGMYQISVESGNNRNRSDCKLKSYKELHDAKKNIWCGTRVFAWFVKEKNLISNAGRYFSVIAGKRDYTRKALAAIKAANK